MDRLLDKVQEELGWQGIFGVLLLALAVMFNTLALAPLEARVKLTSEKAEALRLEASGAQAQRTALDTPDATLDKFYHFFAVGEDVTDELAKLYSLAQANGVDLQQGEYKLVENKESRLAEYQIYLPLKGNYAKIRSFAVQALLKIPVLSLDKVSFQRKKSGETTVEAEIQFTLYLARK